MSLLTDQINEARMQVHTDSYPMSIGELINLYEDEELEIHPEFQRVYRWSSEQKSQFIESILLGIPLPSIFVAQRQDGVWDVVDGLQRISTILSFLGKLKDEENNLIAPLKLQATRYLSALEGKVWEDKNNPNNEIEAEIKRLFKREKIDIKIIKRESDNDTKFELFQRLNTGGSALSEQEVRNCVMLMINRDSYFWLTELSNYSSFQEAVPLSEKQKIECYDQEIALRFIIQRHANNSIRSLHNDIHPYINEELTTIFNKSNSFYYNNEKLIFMKTFDIANAALNDNAFKKYNIQKERYEGAISLPVYEALAIGLSKLIELNKYEDDILIKMFQEKSIELATNQEFQNIFIKRTRPLDRMFLMAELGENLFK